MNSQAPRDPGLAVRCGYLFRHSSILAEVQQHLRDTPGGMLHRGQHTYVILFPTFPWQVNPATFLRCCIPFRRGPRGGSLRQQSTYHIHKSGRWVCTLYGPCSSRLCKSQRGIFPLGTFYMFWRRKGESNSQGAHHARLCSKQFSSPIDLSLQNLAGGGGFEPRANGIKARCSTD